MRLFEMLCVVTAACFLPVHLLRCSSYCPLQQGPPVVTVLNNIQLCASQRAVPINMLHAYLQPALCQPSPLLKLLLLLTPVLLLLQQLLLPCDIQLVPLDAVRELL
jgi:hypothetical protein